MFAGCRTDDIHDVLILVLSNVHLAQASPKSRKLGVLQILFNHHVGEHWFCLEMRICFKVCTIISLFVLVLYYWSAVFLNSCWYWYWQHCSKRCRESLWRVLSLCVSSGPEETPNSSLCTAQRILSNTWSRPASINSFLPRSLSSSKSTNPSSRGWCCCVKTNAETWFTRPHCCAMANVAFASSWGSVLRMTGVARGLPCSYSDISESRIPRRSLFSFWMSATILHDSALRNVFNLNA